MAKTVYSALMQITSVWLNKVFNHRHDGLDQDGSAPIDYAADNGAANAYAIALTPPITAHIPGLPIYFKAANANTGASTLSVNGLAAVAIKRSSGAALSGGEIQAGEIVGVVYNDAATPYYQLNPSNAALLVEHNSNGTHKTSFLTGLFGARTSISPDIIYLAAQDLTVYAGGDSAAGAAIDVIILTDSTNPPTTIGDRDLRGGVGAVTWSASAQCQVRKGDYYKVTAAGVAANGRYYIRTTGY